MAKTGDLNGIPNFHVEDVGRSAMETVQLGRYSQSKKISLNWLASTPKSAASCVSGRRRSPYLVDRLFAVIHRILAALLPSIPKLFTGIHNH